MLHHFPFSDWNSGARSAADLPDHKVRIIPVLLGETIACPTRQATFDTCCLRRSDGLKSHHTRDSGNSEKQRCTRRSQYATPLHPGCLGHGERALHGIFCKRVAAAGHKQPVGAAGTAPATCCYSFSHSRSACGQHPASCPRRYSRCYLLLDKSCWPRVPAGAVLTLWLFTRHEASSFYLTLLRPLRATARSRMDMRRTDQGSCSDQSVLALPQGSLHLLCEVRPSASDEVALARSTCNCGQAALLDQPPQSLSLCCCKLWASPQTFEAVLALAVQQHGAASSLRLTSRTLAHKCGAALVTGETARQAKILPPPHGSAASMNCRHPLPQTTKSVWPARRIPVLAMASGHPPARLPQQHPETEQGGQHNR